MSNRIDSIYYFDYTRNVGFYDSVRDFASLEMVYIGSAISTPKVRVNASPTQYTICEQGTEKVREMVVSQLPYLVEISKVLADNSPRFFKIRYADGSLKYYKYTVCFHQIFQHLKQYEPKDDYGSVQNDNPYAYQESSDSYSPYAIQQPTSHPSNVRISQPVYTKAQSATKPKANEDSFSLWKLAVVVVLSLVIVGLLFYGIIQDSNPGLTPIEEPKSGTILSGQSFFDIHELTITAPNNESCVVKLKSKATEDCLSFYVRAGDTVTINVPDRYLYVYFASGTTWYGEEHLFGNGTNYYMDDKIIDFVNYSWEYILRPVDDGNFDKTPIDSEDF